MAERVRILLSRGVFIGFLIAVPLAFPMAADAPNPQDLQAGDLVWPKSKGAFVPYEAVSSGEPGDRARWIAERDEYVNKLLVEGAESEPFEQEAASELLSRSFEQFERSYLADDEGATAPVPYGSGGPLYVGHVGIIYVTDDGVGVVEAVRPVVRKISYDAWKAARGDDLIWHGRLPGLTPEQRMAVATEALKHVGKPYQFFNFWLDDDAGFYCSKLVWLSAFRSAGISLDDNEEPFRWPWYSPKQLMQSSHVCLLNNPGQYTHDGQACPD